MIALRSDALSATIDPFGAELVDLRDADRRALLHDGDPAWWAGRAPVLFPIVGALAGGTYRLDGREYALPRHGFARRMAFDMIAADAAAATLRLVDDDATRAVYPFAFTLDIGFEVAGATLSVTATLTNTGDRDLPASFGYHPAFAWPLPYGAGREAHALRFDADERATLPALAVDGTLSGTRPSPIRGRTLPLDDVTFADDALILDPVASSCVTYGAPGTPALRVAWDDAPQLGLWGKAGAPFVCIEPWWGHADPHGFSGDIWDKPGIVRLAPGQVRAFAMRITRIGADVVGADGLEPPTSSV